MPLFSGTGHQPAYLGNNEVRVAHVELANITSGTDRVGTSRRAEARPIASFLVRQVAVFGPWHLSTELVTLRLARNINPREHFVLSNEVLIRCDRNRF
jgi:hypothetical protein